MTGLPRVIEGQEKKADEMIASLAKAQVVEIVKDTPYPAEGGEKPPVEPKPVVDTPHPEPVGDDFQQKYSVLQGKYNAEIADWKRRLETAQQTIDRQSTLILELHNRLTSLEKDGGGASDNQGGSEAAPATGPKDLKPLDVEAFEGYGPEMQDLVGGFNMLLERNKHLESKLQEDVKAKADRQWEDFTSRMAKLVPDWEKINVDPAFKDVWLFQKKGRKEMLDYFAGQLDAEGCAEFFLDYKKEVGASAGRTPVPGREQIIQPAASAASPGAPIPGNQTTVVTAAEVKQAGQRYVKGEISLEELEKIQNAFQGSLAQSRRT